MGSLENLRKYLGNLITENEVFRDQRRPRFHVTPSIMGYTPRRGPYFAIPFGAMRSSCFETYKNNTKKYKINPESVSFGAQIRSSLFIEPK